MVTALTQHRPESHTSGPGGLHRIPERDSSGATTCAFLFDLALLDTSPVSLWQPDLPRSAIQSAVSYLVLPDLSEVFRLCPQ